MNYLLMAVGDFFAILAFFATIPATLLSTIAQMFYTAGSIDYNDETDE